MGKIGLGVSRSDPQRVYALIEMKEPAFYRSDDGGKSWRSVNRDHDLLERPQYYTRFGVSPNNGPQGGLEPTGLYLFPRLNSYHLTLTK